ncbi:hypothetical protein ACFE6N_03755 [Pedobacter sp. BG31]|uniref:hypothetical protein n=1 Tax=Pedobacter sp. BG31 TaxID=3349697 RepID=UPI0035F46DA6
MKHSKYKYRREIFPRIWAILLLGVFLNATLIESLHHHAAKHTVNHTSHSKYNAQTVSAKLTCKLCEVLKHRSQFFDRPVPLAFRLPVNKPGVKPSVFLIEQPVAYILSFSNKGPPSLMA